MGRHRLLPGLLPGPEPQLQLDALHTHGYDQLFAEKQSGKHGATRPEFTTALEALQAGDTPRVLEVRPVGPLRRARPDHHRRAARPRRHGQVADRELRPGHQGKAGSCSPSWPPPPNTNSSCAPNGRPKASPPPAAAKAEGRMLPGKKHIGRPRAVGPAELRQLQRMTSEGTTVTQAARILKVSRSTAYAALASTR